PVLHGMIACMRTGRPGSVSPMGGAMGSALLQTSLRRFGRRFLAVRMISGIGWGVTTVLLLLLTSAWLDLLWELPPEVRIVCGAGALALGGVLVLALGWRAVQGMAPKVLARRLDQVGATGGQILSGVDLLQEKRSLPPLTSGLAELAVDHAGRLARTIAGSRAVPAKPVYWSFANLSLLGLGIALVCLAMPQLARTQWLRFADPYGDHPPFSRVLYHVEPGDVSVLYGTGLDIRVTTQGVPVDRVDIVLQNPEVPGGETLPMFPEPGGEWKATIANVTTPGQYWVRSHAGRSRKFSIQVITVPRIEGVRFRIALPAYTNRAPYDGPLPQGGLAGLPGTRVQVWARSNRPLGGGSLEVPGPEGLATVPLTPLSPDSPEA